MNSMIYTVASAITLILIAVIVVGVIAVVVWMIRNWDSPQVQDLDAPVREYMLDGEEHEEYLSSYKK